MKTILLSAATGLIFCLTSATATLAADHLTGEQIKTQVIGVKLGGETRKGKPFTLVFDNGGTGVIDISGEGMRDARWHVDRNTICWKTDTTNDECSYVVAGKGTFRFVDSATGKTNTIYKIVK